MTFPKLLMLVAIFLFGLIAIAGLIKKRGEKKTILFSPAAIEIPIDAKESVFSPAPAANQVAQSVKFDHQPFSDCDLPDANRIEEFFNKNHTGFPFVETITYKSHVPWQKGRPAWLSDYAAHYSTSRHFLARSLNGKPDYNKQDLAEGDRFNVLRKDKNFEFYLVVDTSRCRMWFYVLDFDDKKALLIKTYGVGLGRVDASKTSGLLTPLGKYSLGNRVAIFKPKVTGNYQGEKVEMITVFGTRWIPFETEIGGCTAPAKGFGVHGTPWRQNEQNALFDSQEGLGKYESDGCIRLATCDIEELFSIIISRPTTIEIVRDFCESAYAKSPDLEKTR